MENLIKVKTREGKTLQLSETLKNYSKFIRESLEDAIEDDVINCDITESIFQKIMEFIEHHSKEKDFKNIKKPVKISNFTTLTSEWDTNFFKKLDDDQLAELLNSASYLDIDNLYDYCCAFIACQFKELTSDEVRKKYDIAEELTPELEDIIKKEYPTIMKDLSE